MNMPQALTRIGELEKQVSDLKRAIDWKSVPAWLAAGDDNLKEFTLTTLVELHNTDYGPLTNTYAKERIEEYGTLGF